MEVTLGEAYNQLETFLVDLERLCTLSSLREDMPLREDLPRVWRAPEQELRQMVDLTFFVPRKWFNIYIVIRGDII